MTTSLLAGRRALVLTISDRCYAGTQQDRSGPAVRSVLEAAGGEVLSLQVLPDEAVLISAALREGSRTAGLLLTTGGTGLAPRDVTPEATLAVCERLVPGIAEWVRSDGARRTPFAMLSRGVCGICNGSLVLNLPGSPAGAKSSLESVLHLLPHALALLAGDTEHRHPAQAAHDPRASPVNAEAASERCGVDDTIEAK